jgi:hypothetical protein
MKYALLALILFSNLSYCFDYDAYESETLDGIILHSDKVLDLHVGNEGVDIINPVKPFTVYETLEKMPFQCDTSALLSFMGMVGFQKESLPPINYCITVRSKQNKLVTFYVQDTLVNYINSECEIGSKVQLWAIWVFSNGFDRLPRLLLNEFDAKAPNKRINSDSL